MTHSGLFAGERARTRGGGAAASHSPHSCVRLWTDGTGNTNKARLHKCIVTGTII